MRPGGDRCEDEVGYRRYASCSISLPAGGYLPIFKLCQQGREFLFHRGEQVMRILQTLFNSAGLPSINAMPRSVIWCRAAISPSHWRIYKIQPPG